MEEELEETKPEVQEDEPTRRGPGRPKGSKNKYKVTHVASLTGGGERQVPPTASRHDDFTHADPATMLSRQLSMLSYQQQALRNKIMGGESRFHGASTAEALKDVRSGGRTTIAVDTKELLDLTNAVARQIEAMTRYQKMAKELAAAMTAEELLEAAIAKIEGQSLPTLNYAIKRLRAKRETLAPVLGLERLQIGTDKDDERATTAIADLLKE